MSTHQKFDFVKDAHKCPATLSRMRTARVTVITKYKDPSLSLLSFILFPHLFPAKAPSLSLSLSLFLFLDRPSSSQISEIRVLIFSFCSFRIFHWRSLGMLKKPLQFHFSFLQISVSGLFLQFLTSASLLIRISDSTF